MRGKGVGAFKGEFIHINIRLEVKRMNKRKNLMMGLVLAAAVFTSAIAAPVVTYATESTEVSDNEDEVVITQDDKPYLALGGDLTAEEQHTVLSYMGIDAADLDDYDVVYTTNAEEHEYLDEYVPSEKIGTRSLSSVMISLADEGSGLKISTYNINYCTVGMYKNALATAGVQDANVIVAGPFSLSGTAALVGTLKAYEELTGETLDDDVVDAAMDELVTTGDLEDSIDGDSEDVEAMLAELKSMIANGELDTDEQISDKIDELAKEYDLDISDSDKQKIIDLLQKLKGLDLDWDSIASQANAWADKLQGVVDSVDTGGIGATIKNFFQNIIDSIKSLFGL
jgi:uncharacterized protein YpuA (DUF1002 family)